MCLKTGGGYGLSRVRLFSLLCWNPCLHSVRAPQVFLYILMSIFLLRRNKPQNILPEHLQVYWWFESRAETVTVLKCQSRAGVIDHSIDRVSSRHCHCTAWAHSSNRQQVIVEIWQGEAKSPNGWGLKKVIYVITNHALKNKWRETVTLELGNWFFKVRHLKMVVVLFSETVLLKTTSLSS